MLAVLLPNYIFLVSNFNIKIVKAKKNFSKVKKYFLDSHNKNIIKVVHIIYKFNLLNLFFLIVSEIL